MDCPAPEFITQQLNEEDYHRVFKSPFGELVLGSVDEKLCLCDWRHRKMRQAIDNRLLKGIGGCL